MNNIHEGIQRLLDNTAWFSREDWAVYLDVDEQTLEKWCNGSALPTPRQIWAIIRELDDVKRSELVSPCIPQLIELVRKLSYPASEMSPSVAYVLLQERMHYILPHLIQLPFSTCEEVINGWLRILNDKQEEIRTVPPLREYPPLTLVKREEIPEK